MAKLPKEEITRLLTQAVAEVVKQVEAQESAFGIEDLQKHVSKMRSAGGDSAWKITYDTSDSPMPEQLDVGKIGAMNAWKITYDTAGSPAERLKK